MPNGSMDDMVRLRIPCHLSIRCPFPKYFHPFLFCILTVLADQHPWPMFTVRGNGWRIAALAPG
jgi:hypothetical protein